MAIECSRCGGPTMLETVIKLRRGVFGFHETRSQGGYCATCKRSVPIENMPSCDHHRDPWPRAKAAADFCPCGGASRLPDQAVPNGCSPLFPVRARLRFWRIEREGRFVLGKMATQLPFVH